MQPPPRSRPALTVGRVDSRQPPERLLHGPNEPRALSEPGRGHAKEPRAKRPGQRQQYQRVDEQRQPELDLHTRLRSEILGVEHRDAQVDHQSDGSDHSDPQHHDLPRPDSFSQNAAKPQAARNRTPISATINKSTIQALLS